MKKTEVVEKGYTIKDLPLSERPREKLYSYGPQSLSNAELIAILIRTGHKEDTAIDLAQRILNMDNRGIAFLADTTIQELTQIKGIGSCKAAQILAAVEIGKRINKIGTHDKIKVTSPDILADLMMDEMRYLNKEYFKVAVLDTKNQILTIENVSVGTLNASIVHPRDVFKIAIKRNANSIILIHNHPSGDTTPSNEDINITNRLVDAGNLIGIKVLDHIIIGDNKYLSFKEINLI
ncbi:RadC family protein [Paratissierella segnis]|jgi:DNA repair protein RadC|uniref:DNA repair protein RadC n=1 Tax=Paratissierella segnis TaxID=2763679 RepID=A0A926EUP4_9FIRM|nr:DNA repair protein RadC [Paratissierella segnis]MBC8588845.1 DNA repair protein RadC [Paratissierella segnis]